MKSPAYIIKWHSHLSLYCNSIKIKLFYPLLHQTDFLPISVSSLAGILIMEMLVCLMLPQSVPEVALLMFFFFLLVFCLGNIYYFVFQVTGKCLSVSPNLLWIPLVHFSFPFLYSSILIELFFMLSNTFVCLLFLEFGPCCTACGPFCSPTRDQTHASRIGSTESWPSGPPGKPLHVLILCWRSHQGSSFLLAKSVSNLMTVASNSLG